MPKRYSREFRRSDSERLLGDGEVGSLSQEPALTP